MDPKIDLKTILENHLKWLRNEDGGIRASLSRASLSGANLYGANLDFSALPLWCGGTGITIDRHISLQILYHLFNQKHTDAQIIQCLEPLRPLAQEFVDKYHPDAPKLR